MTVVTAPEAALRLVPGSWWARADFQKGRYGLLPGWASWEERAWAEDALRPSAWRGSSSGSCRRRR